MAYSGLLSSSFYALFYVITLVFVVYSVSVAYHWITYGDRHSLSMLSVAVYLLGSAPLFIIMALSLTLI
jgi:hypothetical protein